MLCNDRQLMCHNDSTLHINYRLVSIHCWPSQKVQYVWPYSVPSMGIQCWFVSSNCSPIGHNRLYPHEIWKFQRIYCFTQIIPYSTSSSRIPFEVYDKNLGQSGNVQFLNRPSFVLAFRTFPIINIFTVKEIIQTFVNVRWCQISGDRWHLKT